MTYYRKCPSCGACLDPGEPCDCQNKEDAALSAANTQDGKAEKMPVQHNSASILPETKEDCQV